MSKGSQAADAEGASSSSKDEIVRGLNEDLAREYKAIIQYVVFSSTLKGGVSRHRRAVKAARITGASARIRGG
jgi:O-succinylbenzoate synthase